MLASDSIRTQKEKLEILNKFSSPATSQRPVRSLRSFLGLTGYYRKFIKDYAKIAAPLYKLTEKNAKFEWSDECQQAFDKLKMSLMSAPPLAFPDFTKSFIIFTDACDMGIAGILTQMIDGQEGNCLICRQRFKRS